MVRSVLSFFLFCALSVAQVTSISTGCISYHGPVNLTCLSGSTPLGMFVDFEVTASSAQDLPFGSVVWLLVGFTNDTTIPAFNLPLPVDMGLFFPFLNGCSLYTSALESVATTAQRDGACRMSFFFPLGFSGPFNIQALVPDEGPVGFNFSSNYLEYHNN